MSFLTLDLNLLRVFDAVMTEQNLTRAAGRLAMTQPAVSNALKRLRDSLGDELVIRTAHGVKPTPRAETLWPAVRRALAELEDAVSPTVFDPSEADDTFRMAMSDGSASLWLPKLVRIIDRTAPDVKIRMVPLTTRDPRAQLLRGDIDLAIGFFPGVVNQLATMPDTPVRHEQLYSGQYVCVLRKGHRLEKEKLTVDNYCDASHLMVSPSGRARGLVDDALGTLGRERQVRLTVNQFATAGRVVNNSDLIMVIPHHLIEATGMTETLVVKALPFPMPDVNVDMLWHERDNRRAAHKWLRQQMSEMTNKARFVPILPE